MEVFSNTLQFRFPAGASPPSWMEIAEFIKRIHTDVMQVEVVYKFPPQRSVCMKYKTREAMEEAQRRNAGVIKFYYADGKVVDVDVTTAGSNVAYVRLFDLPPEVNDNVLDTALSHYGKVVKIVREKFPTGLGLDHLLTGVRGVYLELEIGKEIPASLEINTWKVRVFYDGLKEKCFLCNQEGHFKACCPMRKTKSKTEKKQKEKRQPASYAGVVETGTASLSDDVVIIEEEITPEEVIQQTVVSVVEQMQMEQQRKVQAEEEEKRRRQEKALADLTKWTSSVIEAVNKQEANDRRAQFAAAGSTSTEMLRPKKTARKS